MTLDALAEQLEATGDYRVLRRVPKPRAIDPGAVEPGGRIGIVLDCETTGLDPAACEVVELAMVAFAYDDAGPGHVLRTFSGLQEPVGGLPPEIQRLTGITPETVAGRQIDDAEVEAFIAGAAFVIAHKAEFDRPFVERRWPLFERRPWGCSLTQVPWREEGFEAASLKALLAEAGLFHRGHRALDDCLATLHLLGVPLPVSSRTPMACILERSRAPSTRLWATGSPFECKDALKQRGYRWSDGSGGLPKAWHIDVAQADREAELGFLERQIYRGRSNALAVPITARHRFSVRAGRPSEGSP